MTKALFLVRGLPGSGKSTFSKFLCRSEDICEADKFFMVEGQYRFDASRLKQAHEWCRSQVEARMQMDVDRIVVSNTFTREWEMAPYFELATKFGYSVFSVIVENRHGSTSVHNVPAASIDAMKNRFELKL